jgi:F-type H+-transporting ATPase subunit epsilon
MKVQLLSPGRPLADVEADSVSIPGSLGRMEILKNHAAMIAEIDCGGLSIKKSSGEELHFFVSGGYVNVESNVVKILVDVGEPSDEIDRKRAESSLSRARDRLVNIHPDVDLSRALFAERKARARIGIASKSGLSD